MSMVDEIKTWINYIDEIVYCYPSPATEGFSTGFVTMFEDDLESLKVLMREIVEVFEAMEPANNQ